MHDDLQDDTTTQIYGLSQIDPEDKQLGGSFRLLDQLTGGCKKQVVTILKMFDTCSV